MAPKIEDRERVQIQLAQLLSKYDIQSLVTNFVDCLQQLKSD